MRDFLPLAAWADVTRNDGLDRGYAWSRLRDLVRRGGENGAL
jgi:hypothetical protein